MGALVHQPATVGPSRWQLPVPVRRPVAGRRRGPTAGGRPGRLPGRRRGGAQAWAEV